MSAAVTANEIETMVPRTRETVTAADRLGINRNTLHKKLEQYTANGKSQSEEVMSEPEA